MKLTQDVKEYVALKVRNALPKPTSKDKHDEVYNALKDCVAQYNAALEQFTKEFIENAMKNDILKGCEFTPYLGRTNLSFSANGSPYVNTYVEESEDYEKFKSEVTLRILANLSIKKDADDIDTLINDCLKKEGII